MKSIACGGSRRSVGALVFAAICIALGGCSGPPPPPSAAAVSGSASKATGDAAPEAAPHADTGIAWETGDVDAAFTKARAHGKPLFLYWGAVWCPPCNQVKATLFNRQDFIERSRLFVPVYLDGDKPSAQKVAARFKVSGYPTMILFTPDGREITRLPGEVETGQYMRVLSLGMGGARPVRETLAEALRSERAGKGSLTADDWRMLSFYSWETDEQQLVAKDKRTATLQRLAKACPADQAQTALRLRLQALISAATAKGASDAAAHDDPEAIAALDQALSDEAFARPNFDVIAYYPSELVRYATRPRMPARQQLVDRFNAVLDRFVRDATLSTGDRLSALSAQVALAKVDAPKGNAPAAVPPALQARVQEQVTKADAEARSPYERQAVISSGADVLSDAGLLDASDMLLQRELARSQAPYYYMLGLAQNAKARGDKAGSLAWAQKAYASAEGPATRLQWGAHYVSALIELTPDDAAAIDKAAGQVISELEPSPDTFYERNRRGLERMGRKLVAWSASSKQPATLAHLRSQMTSVCAKLPRQDPARATCEGVLRPARAATA